MNCPQRSARPRFVATSLAALLASTIAAAQSRTYTLNADFDEGTLSSVNHTLVADQLQLDTNPGGQNLNFVALATTGRNTLVRFDANTGQIFGEYRTAPLGLQRNPSRTSVDSAGNVWVGNRDEVSGGMGSVCRIGLVVGGTRVDANGQPNPSGLFLAPPYLYNTCVDRDGDGLIRTSRGLNDVLDWPNVTDGAGGSDGLVQDALDECIQIFQRTTGTQVRHVSVDANDDVWVGGYPFFPTSFDKISGVNGARLTTFASPGCGGHGGVFAPGGILWSTSLTENTVLRYDTNTNTGTCIPVLSPHGLTRDSQGNIWVAQFDLNMVTKIMPNGTVFPGFPQRSGGASFDRSLAVTFADDNVWVGNSGGNNVSRLSNTASLRKLIDLGPNGNSPRGVSVDGNGKVWVTNFGSNNAMRIDPNGGGDGLGAVDMTVDLGANAAPYNIGDMTGTVALGATQPNGTWNVVFDSGTQNTEFGTISWNASVPAGTGFAVAFRAANQVAQLPNAPFQPATNGLQFSGVFGRFVEIEASFTRATPSTTASPVLFDLTIQALPGQPPSACEPGQRHPSSLLVFPEFDNRRADLTLLTVTNVASDGDDVDVEYVYIGRVGAGGQVLDCLETNRTRRLTPRDTITLITKNDNPNAVQGYVYVFAKSKFTGHAIVHDFLVGNALVMRSIEELSYSFNPYGFMGVGNPGEETDRDHDGIRDLNNLEYQCTSDETLVPRFFGQGQTITSDLVLINLTGGAAFTATLDFLIYNDNEEEFSEEHSFRCWEKLPLVEISNVFTNDFLLSTSQALNEDIGIETGWFRINGDVANSSAASFDDPAFLALLIERVGPRGVSDLPFETGTQTNGDLLPRGVLGDTTP